MLNKECLGYHETSLLDLVKDIFADTIDFPDKTQERQFYESITNYIYYSTKINIRTKLINLMKTLRTHQSKNFISLAEGIKREGIEKGIEKGIKKVAFSMILDNFSNQQIMKLTHLSEKQVEYLRTLKEFQLD